MVERTVTCAFLSVSLSRSRPWSTRSTMVERTNRQLGVSHGRTRQRAVVPWSNESLMGGGVKDGRGVTCAFCTESVGLDRSVSTMVDGDLCFH